VRGTDTGSAVLDGLVRDTELGEVVADHLGLDLDLVEVLAGVDGDDGADHLGDDDHVTEVGADGVGLLVGLGVLLRNPELLDETHGLYNVSGGPCEIPALQTLRFRPRLNRRRARAWTRSLSSSEPRSSSSASHQYTAYVIMSPASSRYRRCWVVLTFEVNSLHCELEYDAMTVYCATYPVAELLEASLGLKGCSFVSKTAPRVVPLRRRRSQLESIAREEGSGNREGAYRQRPRRRIRSQP
jgi:hypothetical protein